MIQLTILKDDLFAIVTHLPITALLYEAFKKVFVVESVLEIQYLTEEPS
jgi:hypothetical protein